jgi:urocanate hydratase
MHFWDYGNSFLLESSKHKADIFNGNKFKYPSYFETVMDDIFGLGFGPFRWICTSGKHEDLLITDKLAE